MAKKVALITGIGGQDGSYLAEFLLEKGYEVHGIERTTPKKTQFSDLVKKSFLYRGDVGDSAFVKNVITKIKPNEIYHLASKAEVGVSFDYDESIWQTNLMSVQNILETIRRSAPKSKLFFASSAKIFGNPLTSPQNEKTPYNPISFYGIAKAAGTYLIKMYREHFNVFASSGILFNHESPRRNPEFLPRKITQGAAKIKIGLMEKLVLGDIEARRDWGFAGDYVEAMWLMLQQDKPDDFVIGTGKPHSVKNILEIAFGFVGLDWEKYVEVGDKKFQSPIDQKEIVADPSKARNQLGWQPRVNFNELILMMVKDDLDGIEK